MNCTNKQQETAECEKRGCEGCYYDDKIEVGDYIRTKTGNITKIIAIKDTLVWTDDFIDVHCRYNEGIVEKMDIAKHSSNIIDLIEVRRLCKWV